MYTSEELDFGRYQGAEDISSGGTSMFAPDPVFFYTSSRTDFVSLSHDWYDTSTPFFLTNKGLSISLPVNDSASGWSGAFSSPLGQGQQAPLVTLCLSGSELGAGMSLWLKGSAVFLAPSQDDAMSYTRCRGKDEGGQRPWPRMFRGHLLSFSMPSSLFKHHFRVKSMFARAMYGCQSLFAWDQAPEAAVVVLNDAETDLTIDAADTGISSGVFSLASLSKSSIYLQTGTCSSGLIYRVTRYSQVRRSVEFDFTILVRAAKWSRSVVAPDEDAEGERDDPFYWRCDLITKSWERENIARDSDRWMMGNRPLTLSEILDLPVEGIDEGPIDHHNVLVRRTIRDKESGKDVTVTVCVSLVGRSCWVTNPTASSIKFMYVTEDRPGAAYQDPLGGYHLL